MVKVKPGEIREGSEIGKSAGHTYIWHACARCGKARWAELRKGQPRSVVCADCKSRYRDLKTGGFAPKPEKKSPPEFPPKEIMFRCAFCGKDRPLEGSRMITRLFPPVPVCRTCFDKD